MRIAMIIEAWEPIWGGGQAHVLELSKKLAENHNCEIDIFTMNFLDENKKKQTEIEIQCNGKVRLIRTGKIRSFNFNNRLFWIFEVISAIKKHHQEKKYDLIHAHANLPGIPGKILSKLLKIPVIYTVHGSNLLDIGKKNILYFIEKILYTKLKYDAEISVNSKFLEYKNVNRPSVITNGVDIKKFEEASKKYSSQKDKNSFRITFVGRLDKVKGIDILIRSIKNIELELESRKLKVFLVGYGYEEEKFRKLVSNLKLDRLIEFRGKILGEDLLKEYVTADLFILPSRSEGQPLTLLEAWAAKLPVIVTDVGDNKYFIKNSINGYIIPPQNVDKLSEKILEAISNPGLKMLGENGYQVVKEKYSWDDIALKTYEIYKQILK